jgi:uncharacterized protein (TIGR03437 family)
MKLPAPARIFPLAAILVSGLFPGLSRAQFGQSFVINTLVGGAGGALNGYGFSGDTGPAGMAQLNNPAGLTLDTKGNLYIADQGNQRIRQVVLSTQIINTIAGSGTAAYAGDAAAATSAYLNAPTAVLTDSSGNVYISDTVNNVIREVTLSNSYINTIAGDNALGAGFSGDNGPPTDATFNLPGPIAFDSSANMYIADTANNRIRKVSFSASLVTTIAGNTTDGGYSGNGGVAKLAALNGPRGLVLDASGNIYIADSNNNVIRMINAVTGIISTVIGNGTAGFAGDGGPALQAELNSPRGLAFDSSGNLYIADYNNSRIREVVNGTITTIAGGAGPVFGYGGDGSVGTQAVLNFPSALVVDSSGNVYVSDTGNNAIRILTPIPTPPSIKKGGVESASSFGGCFSAAPGSWIEIYGSSLAPDTRSWTQADFSGGHGPAGLDNVTITVGGQYAFISYISGGQVDAQVPTGIGTGPQTLYLSTSAGTTSPYTLNINAIEPGLYAPPSFNVGGKQYVGAVFPDGTYAAPPSIPNITSERPQPGDTIILYGIGFGPVSDNVGAGFIATQLDYITSLPPLQILFGQTPATISYEGLAPGTVGLYQFNVVVPNVPASDAVPLSFTVGGSSGCQVLYTSVGG